MAKHRKTSTDVKANEDLWRQQLGRFADEPGAQQTVAPPAPPKELKVANTSNDPHHELKWLNQIQPMERRQSVRSEASSVSAKQVQAVAVNAAMGAPKRPPSLAPHQSKQHYLDILAQVRATNEKQASEEERQSHASSAAFSFVLRNGQPTGSVLGLF